MHDVPALTIAEVAARLGQAGFFVFDNNGVGRYKRSHVPTSRQLNAYTFAPHDLPDDKTSTLVFYCSGPG